LQEKNVICKPVLTSPSHQRKLTGLRYRESLRTHVEVLASPNLCNQRIKQFEGLKQCPLEVLTDNIGEANFTPAMGDAP
jgi:hypothetical protein